MSQDITPSYETVTNVFKTKPSVSRRYAYWRFRLTYALIVGYAAFYMVRQNFVVAKASDKFPFSMEVIGWSFTAFTLIYGTFKFIAGAICDRSSARLFMPIGLALASVTSLIAGCCNSAFLFGSVYAINACFQSMGWPSVSRTLTQWFGPRQLGTRWGIVNASHQIGAIIILMGGAWLLAHYNWRYLFIVPGCICLLLSIWLWDRLRDTPESIGLPSVEEFEGIMPQKITKKSEEESKESFMKMMREHILFNYRLWMVCIANFFVYFVRLGLFCWAPVMIAQTQNCGVVTAGCKTSIMETGGLLGGLFVGWFTDRFMPKRRGICGAYMMILLGIVFAFYWTFHSPLVQDEFLLALINHPATDYLFWCIIGFLLYGPQTLGGLSGAEFGSKKAAAAATGLTGTVGYMAGSFGGIGITFINKLWGWNAVLLSFVFASFIGGFFFALTASNKKHRRA